MKSRATWLLCGAAVCIIGHSHQVLAQTASTSSGTGATPSDPPATDTGEGIVVTGSRIPRATYSSPSPIAILNADEIGKAGTSSTYEVLTRMPQFGAGTGPATSDKKGGEQGSNFVDLRGLGVNRTLVLIDGQRHVSGSGTQSAVELSSIPSNALKRVEVITGGAAAVYGADAVSGVVNLILRDDVNGLELTTRQGLSDHGDVYSYTYQGLFGSALGDRGRVMVAVSYNHDAKFNTSSRSYASRYPFFGRNPASTGPNDGITDTTLYNDLHITQYQATGGFQFDDGTDFYTADASGLHVVDDGEPINGVGSGLGQGGTGYNIVTDYWDRPRQATTSAIMHMDYDVTDAVKLSTDLQFANTTTHGSAGFWNADPIPISIDNPLVPAAVHDRMIASGMDSIYVARSDAAIGNFGASLRRQTYTGVLKLSGEISNDIQWQIFGQYGEFTNRDTFLNDTNVRKFLNATDVVTGSNGSPVCRINAVSVADPGCVPYSMFGANPVSQAQLDYFAAEATSHITNSQVVAGGQVTGKLFALAAGDAKFAAGVEYRREKTTVRTVSDAAERVFTPGGNLTGSFDVKEVFGEVTIPILKDRPFVHALEIDGAARFSHYSTVGSTFTWKLGGVYAPVPDVSLRVTRSRSVRAPNINELFTAATNVQVFRNDPCDGGNQSVGSSTRASNCASQGLANFVDPDINTLLNVTLGGNPDLKAEKSDSITAGLILQPRAIPGLNASLDFFQIKIKNAIGTLTDQEIYSGCYNGPSLDPAFCNLIQRNAAGRITNVLLTQQNFGSLEEERLDFAIDYRRTVGVVGDKPLALFTAVSGSYYWKNNLIVDPTNSDNIVHRAGQLSVMPKVRVNLSVGATIGKLTISPTFRLIGATKYDPDAPEEQYGDANRIPTYLYTDLNVNYDLTPAFGVGLGVLNLTGKKPPTLANFSNAFYDNIGRYVFATLRWKI